jgi:3-oxoadipate enol-lactonase
VKRVTLASGGAVAYWETGSGPPLVQVHGVGTGHKNFVALTPLIRGVRVIDFDLPGYGESDPSQHGRSVFDFADDVASFIRALGLEQAHVHGSSMGGRIALALAASHPDVVDRLVVSLAFARPDKAALRMRESWRQAAEYGGTRALVDLTCLQGFSRGFWDREDAAAVIEVFTDAAGMTSTETFVSDVKTTTVTVDLEDHVGKITADTLLIAAEEDIMNPLRMAASGVGMADLARLIPKARVEIVPGGHFALFETPEHVASAISAFLGE